MQMIRSCIHPPKLRVHACTSSEMGAVRRIGLTGGIATGKSTVAALLSQRHGIPVLDADRFAREALAPGMEATQAVLRRYGQVVCASLRANGLPVLDRHALADIVFGDAAERLWLERLIHPIVAERFASDLARLQAEPVVVLMIPLLFEAGLEHLCSEIWVVTSGSEDEQVRRLQARDGLTRVDSERRLAAQWPMAEKLARADVVIANTGTLAELQAQVDAALAGTLAP